LASASVTGTIITGTGQAAASLDDTDPNTAARTAPRRRDPTTTIAACFCAATADSRAAG
jgi:hypothetical protein